MTETSTGSAQNAATSSRTSSSASSHHARPAVDTTSTAVDPHLASAPSQPPPHPRALPPPPPRTPSPGPPNPTPTSSHSSRSSSSASSYPVNSSRSHVPQFDLHQDRANPFSFTRTPIRTCADPDGADAERVHSRSTSLRATRPAPPPPASSSHTSNHHANPDDAESPAKETVERSITSEGQTPAPHVRRRKPRPPPGPIVPRGHARRRALKQDDVIGEERQPSTRRVEREDDGRGARWAPASFAFRSRDASETEAEDDARTPRARPAPELAHEPDQNGETEDYSEEDPDDELLREEMLEEGINPSSAIWDSIGLSSQSHRGSQRTASASISRRTNTRSTVGSVRPDTRKHSRTRPESLSGSTRAASLTEAEAGRSTRSMRSAHSSTSTQRRRKEGGGRLPGSNGIARAASAVGRAASAAGSIHSISPPEPPRRPTIASTVSYTSAVVVTSIFADIRNDAIAMAGEFVGTILFLITSLGSAQAVASMRQSGDAPENPEWSTTERLVATFYRAIASGFALYGTASIFYRFTGSIFNPSVSLALAVCRVIRPVRFILVSASQMLGGIVAAWILRGLLPGESQINLELSASANIGQGLFIETFATTTLILAVLMLGVEKHLVTPHAPLGFGLTLTAAMLFAMPYTGAGINVARAFGTALVEGFQPYHWIYWLGPTIGALLASAFYTFLRAIQYWQVNPGQDSTQPLTALPEPGKKMRKERGIKKRDMLSPPS